MPDEGKNKGNKDTNKKKGIWKSLGNAFGGGEGGGGLPIPTKWLSAAGGILGGLGGKSSGKAANRPQKWDSYTYNLPFGGQHGLDRLSAMMRGADNAYGQGTPNLDSAFNNFANFVNQGPGNIQYGGPEQYTKPEGYNTEAFGGNAFFEAGSSPDYASILQSLSRGGGGGGGGGGGFRNLGSLSTKANKWEKKVLEGEFLGESNPYLQEIAANISRESLENYKNSIVPQLSSSAQGAGALNGGMSGLNQVLANEEYNESIQSTLAQLYGGAYESERDRMMQAMGMQSSEDAALRSSVAAAKAQLGSARIGANASTQNTLLNLLQRGHEFDTSGARQDFQYGTNLGYDDFSRIQRSNQEQYQYDTNFDQRQYEFDTNAWQDYYNNERSYDLNKYNSQGGALSDLFGAAGSYDSTGMDRQGQYMAQILSILQGFGSQGSFGTGTPPQSSPWGAAATGALGGAMTGYGMGGKKK